MIQFKFIPTAKVSICLLLLFSCSVSTEKLNDRIDAQVSPSVVPTISKILELPNKPLRFAIISDLTGGERKGVFDVAANQLSLMQPDFILSIGDLIEGGTEDISVLRSEWASFSQKMKKAQVPFYPVVGNHDISNPTQRQWWQQEVAPRYYHFRVEHALFLVMDSEDFSDNRFNEMKKIRQAGLTVYKENPVAFKDTEYANLHEREFGHFSKTQRDYFIQAIKDNSDASWVFIFMHKPIWSDKQATYYLDVEAALGEQPFSVFSGHVHAYEHTHKNGRDYIQLGTTGGALVPVESGTYMDHIMWVTLNRGDAPKYTNLMLTGMRNIKGDIPIEGQRPCFADDRCSR